MMQIMNPLTGKMGNIPTVLKMLASQEGCDGEPYDQMQQAAEHIEHIEYIDEFKNEMLIQLEKMEKHASSTEEKIDILYNLARLVSRADNLFSTTWANRVRKLLLKLRNLDEIRYQTEVMDK